MNEKIKVLKTIHLAICAGTMLAYYFIGNFSNNTISDLKFNSTEILFFAIPILAYFISNLLFKNQLKIVDSKLKLEEKLPFYQSASVIRWAVLEGTAIIILFVCPNLIFLGILIIIYLISLFPSLKLIESDFSNLR